MTASENQVRAAVAQQAGTWFVANQTGSLATAERAEFMTWLKASPIHVEEYLGVALVAHDLPAAADDPEVPLESLIEMARADDSDTIVSLVATWPVREEAPRRAWAPRWSFASLAALALLAASVLWWVRDGELLGLPKTYRTGHGQQVAVQLPDGSALQLNTDTEATVRFTRRERLVEIARGQAFVTATRGDERRFRVAGGHAQVLAVGTRFDVYRRPDATTITVVEGSVAVLAGPHPPSGTGIPPHALRVDAGYQVRVDAGSIPAHPIPVDVQQHVAWLQQKIAFERRPLGEVADEFNRYGPIPIEIEDAALRALPISGVFDAKDLDSFVAFLQTLDGVRVERTAARVRVSKLKPQKE